MKAQAKGLENRIKSISKPIHPVAKYVFYCNNNAFFVSDQCVGKDIFDIRKLKLEIFPLPMMFSHRITDDRGGVVTTLTFLPEMQRRASGEYNNHAMLIEITEDCNELTLLFFENMGIYQCELLQRWNAGKLVIEVEIIPLLERKTEERRLMKCIHNNVYIHTLFNLVKRLFFLLKKGDLPPCMIK